MCGNILIIKDQIKEFSILNESTELLKRSQGKPKKNTNCLNKDEAKSNKYLRKNSLHNEVTVDNYCRMLAQRQIMKC